MGHSIPDPRRRRANERRSGAARATIHRAGAHGGLQSRDRSEFVDPRRAVELQDYLLVVRKRWRVILLVVLICVGLASAQPSPATKIYESRTQFFVSTTGSDDSGALLQGSTFTQQRVKSYAQLLTTPRILAPVAEAVGVTGDIADQVTATTPPDTVLIEVAVRDPQPRAGQGHRHRDRQGVPDRGRRARDPTRHRGEPGQGDRRAAPDHARSPRSAPSRCATSPSARCSACCWVSARPWCARRSTRRSRPRTTSRPSPTRPILGAHPARPGCRQAPADRRGRPPLAAGRGVPVAAHQPAVHRRRQPPAHPASSRLPGR